MLQAIVHWSIYNRVVVVTLSLLLLGAGIHAAWTSRLDVFPEFAPPQVDIQTEAPGLSAEQVEQLVTLRIEEEINGMARLATLRSKSIQGLSVVTVVFEDGVNIYQGRQQVSERLGALAGKLPEGVRPPRLSPLTASTGRLLTVGFTSPDLSPMDLRDQVQWSIRPRLLSLPGIAQVTLMGGEVRQFQVRILPEALEAHHLTLTDVLEATRQASGIRGAGFLENNSQRLNIRVEGQIQSIGQLGETVIKAADGSAVLLRDVAQVVEGPEPKFGDAAINGEPGVLAVAYKQVDGDTLEITRRLEAELDRMKPGLEKLGITYHPALFRQAKFIDQAIGNVTESLYLGAFLVAVVLFLFLFDLRTAFISLTAIPLSLLTAVFVLKLWGVSLNTLTLGGLAIAVGEVVDDAIIDVENIFRRLRENASLPQPRSAAAVVLAASLEVRTAVVYATFIVVLVFVPVFFLTGLQGRLFAPLGYAYVLAVMASLGVAMSITPALSMLFLTARFRAAPSTTSSFLLRWMQRSYEKLLRNLDRHAALTGMVVVLMVAGAGWALHDFGGAFLPELRENHFVIHMRGLPGTSLSQSLATGKILTDKLNEMESVRTVTQQTGRAELGEDTWGVDYTEFEVDLNPLDAESAEHLAVEIKQMVGQNFPGYSFSVMSFLSERISETLSGTEAAVAIQIQCEDFVALDQAAQDVADLVAKVPGTDNVRAEAQIGVPELIIRIRPLDAARFGLRQAQVLDALHAAYQGAEVNQVYDRNRIIDLVVILDPGTRSDPRAVAELWLTAGSQDSATRGPAQGRIQLKQIADVFWIEGRFLVSHEGGRRRQVVTCKIKSRHDLSTVVAEVERKVAAMSLPPGVTYAFTGEQEARRAAKRELVFLSLAAGVGVVLLLWLVFRSIRRLILVLINLPFALVGGVAAIYLAGGVLDVGSLIGFVTLFGITMRNGIMMVAHWQHLHEVEGVAWGPELIFRGARERLAPVLMTALVTALGLLPIALGSGEAGREIEGPMALVILGGLATSMTLNLFVLPMLYRRFGISKSEGVSHA